MNESWNSKMGMYALYTVSIKTDNVFIKISYKKKLVSRVYVFLWNIQNE